MFGDNQFVACSREPLLRMFDLDSSDEIASFEGHKVSVNCLDVSTNKNRMVSGGRDCTTIVWDIETQKANIFILYKKGICSCDISSNES